MNRSRMTQPGTFARRNEKEMIALHSVISANVAVLAPQSALCSSIPCISAADRTDPLLNYVK